MTLLENYLKSKRVNKVLKTKPGEEGFSLVELVVVIAVLAILSAVAIPAFNGVTAGARAAAVKNGLVNGVKECTIRASDNQLTNNRQLAQSFANNTAYNGYVLSGWNGTGNTANGTCYNALATASNAGDANFWIDMSTSGVVIKGCSNASYRGCEGSGTSAGTW